jgi:cardiolipin synthase
VFVRDDAFAAELRAHLVDAIAQGRRVEPDAITRWSMVARGLTWVAYGVMRALVFVAGKRY